MKHTHPTAVICAGQRSGTTALHHVFRKNGLFCPGEIFHPTRRENDSFFEFLEVENISAEQQIQNPETVWESYLEYLGKFADDRNIILDIKYNSWHHFNGAWQQPLNPPRLLKLLPPSCWIIHIVRDDVFAQVMSGVIAQQRGKFHSRDETDLTDLEFSVNPKNFQSRVRLINQTKQCYLDWLQQRKNTVLLHYEGMFSDNKLTENAQKIIARTGIELSDIETSLRKPKTDFTLMVKNYSELKEAYLQVA